MMKNIFTTIVFLALIMLSYNMKANGNSLDLVSGVVCSVTSTDVSCGQANGTATATATSGTAPYTYLWSNGESAASLTGLTAGVYSVTVTDATGCESVCIANVQDIGLVVSIDCASTDNTVSANATGTAPFTYLWDDGSTSQEIAVVDNTSYSVVVTDANGCAGFDTYTHTSFNGSIFCNDVINLSIAPSSVINPEVLVQGPIAECDTDIQFRLTDDQGDLVTDYTYSFALDCSHIGNLSYDLIDNISGLECSGLLVIEDKNPPIIICIQDATVVMDDNQQAEIYASDFDAGSYDFCPSGPLRYTFSSLNPDNDPDYDSSINSSRLEIGCDEFFGVPELTIYVWDESDNFNSCQVSVNFDDTANPCNLAGDHIQVVDSSCEVGNFDKYDVFINGTEIASVGCYYPLDAANIVPGTNVMSLEDSGTAELLNGVSTLDIILFHRGLLNGFNSGFEAVLSDFDGDLAVSTQDLTMMRMGILGLLTDIDAPYYKIFPADYVFPVDFNPYDQMIDFTTFEFDESEVGDDLQVHIYKTGDLNNTANFNEGNVVESREDGQISFDDINMEAGQTYFIDFEAAAGDGFGASVFGLSALGLEIKSIDYHGADIIENLEDESIKLSFNNLVGTDNFTFTLEVEAIQNISAANAFSMDEDFLNEVGFLDLSIGHFSLSANDVTGVQEVIVGGINIFPNPTNDFVNLDFDSSFEGFEKQVEIIALDGRVLHAFKSGENQFQIDISAINVSGLNIIKVQIGNKIMLSKLLVN